MKILVTGGAGFIGSHIVDALKNHEVIIYDNLSTGKQENVMNKWVTKKNVISISGDDIDDVDVIIHNAAQVSSFKSVDNPMRDFRDNCLSTFKLLEAWRKHNPDAYFIYTSSRSVLGNVETGLADEKTPINPNTLYALHKSYGENLCKLYSELYGLRYTIIRPANVYGPRQPYWVKGWYNFISHWIKLSQEDKPIPIYGTGEQIRDYVYVTDVADAYEKVVKKRPKNETFQLCSSAGTSLKELAHIIIILTGSFSKIKHHPQRKGDINRFVGSYRHANEKLDWSPIVELGNGLWNEIKWMSTQLKKQN